MKKLHADRLEKLASFLEQLPRKKFDFSAIVCGTDMPRKDLGCGSQACAIGWCPVVFPRLAEYYREPHPWSTDLSIFVRPKGETYGDMIDVGRVLFGLSPNETEALFDPNCSVCREDLRLAETGENATPKAVAKNIRKFIKIKQAAK